MARRSAGSLLSTTMYWQTSSRVTWNRWATVLYVALGSARAASWTTARRSSSLLLISTSSWATSPPFRRRHVAENGHFYLARSGHFHLAATGQRTDKRGSVASAPLLTPTSQPSRARLR